MTGRLGGRDWNGKVFGEIVATQIEVVASKEQRTAGKHREESASSGAVPSSDLPEEDSIPF